MKRTLLVLTHLAAGVLLLAGNSCSVVGDYGDEFNDITPGDSLEQIYEVDKDKEKENEKDFSEYVPVVLTESERVLVREGNAFNLKLLAQAAKNAGVKENVLLSPLSLQMGLGLLGNGMSDMAFYEMAAAMYHQGTTCEDLNRLFADLYDPLTNRKDASVCRIANSLWVQNGFAINPDFKLHTEQYAGGRVSYVDFVNAADEAKKSMNDWASRVTDGLISQLSVPVTSATRMVLLNALMLRAGWELKVLNETFPFNNSDGSTSKVTMLELDASIQNHDHHTSVSYDYDNGTFYMTWSLPDKGYSVMDILPDVLETGQTLVDEYDMAIKFHARVPKFESRTCNILTPMLRNLGIRHLFEDGDALAGINENLILDTVIQDGYISVHERGTDAAAVTEFETVGADFSNPVTNEINFDRPFVYTIRESSTGVILYAGIVNNL